MGLIKMSYTNQMYDNTTYLIFNGAITLFHIHT